jgi:Amt family ammonium transporter
MSEIAQWRWLLLLGLAAALAVLLADAPALAQGTPAVAASPAAPALTLEGIDAKADSAALAGHNAWMLTSCALVLFMTAPGLAMFYGGLVRKKNVLGVIMQCMTLMCLMTVIWGLYGY